MAGGENDFKTEHKHRNSDYAAVSSPQPQLHVNARLIFLEQNLAGVVAAIKNSFVL